MRERPDYLPRYWGTRWPLPIRWIKDKPQRAVGYFLGWLALAIALLVVAVAIGDSNMLILGVILSVVTVIQSCIYVPRALRALQRNRPT